MRLNNFEAKILVGGKPIHEYEHQGNFFVEGRRGSDFEIEFRNNTAQRVLAVPSVDGLSVMDGKPATPDSVGFVVAAHSTLRIPGWRLDAKGAAKFVFEDKDRSYARTGGTQDASRAGVIGFIVYAEKVQAYIPAPVIQPFIHTTYQPFWNGSPRGPYDVMRGVGSGIGGVTGSASDNMAGPQHQNMWESTSTMGGADNIATASAAAAPTSFNAAPQTSKGGKRRLTSAKVTESASPFEMGTGFGKKTTFETSEVQFNRGDQVAQLIIYYDSRRNLEKRGIEVVRKQRTYLEDLPQPFQTAGCTPPPGWQNKR